MGYFNFRRRGRRRSLHRFLSPWQNFHRRKGRYGGNYEDKPPFPDYGIKEPDEEHGSSIGNKRLSKNKSNKNAQPTEDSRSDEDSTQPEVTTGRDKEIEEAFARDRKLYGASKFKRGKKRIYPNYPGFIPWDNPKYVKPTSYDEHIDLYDYSRPMETVVDIFPRDVWGADPPTSEESLDRPISRVFLFYTGTDGCFTKNECLQAVKRLQKHFMEEKGLPDIPYNFLIGTDGNVYEGRGWGINPTKVHKLFQYRKYHKETIDIAFIGLDFRERQMTEEFECGWWKKDSFVVPMIKATELLLQVGTKANFLRGDFALKTEVTP